MCNAWTRSMPAGRSLSVADLDGDGRPGLVADGELLNRRTPKVGPGALRVDAALPLALY